MTQVYTVEIDGQQYDIEGDRPPNEAEARAAVSAHTGAAHTDGTHEQPGALSRFMEPIGQAAKAALGLPAAAVRGFGALNDAAEQASQGNAKPMADIGGGIYHAVVDPSIAEARKGGEAWNQENYVEGAGHGAAALLPVIGPAAAEAGETMASGNVAGGLGQAAVALAPFAKTPEFSGALSRLMKNRAAARIFDVMKPTAARAKTAERIAWDVVNGTPGRETAGGIGVGGRAKLAQKAIGRSDAAGKAVEALQALDTPVNPAPISSGLRAQAVKKQTQYPTRQVADYVDIGLVDEGGDPLMRFDTKNVTPEPTSKNQGLVDALNSQASDLDKMVANFGQEGGTVPAGELFKSRAVTNERIGDKAYEKLPGQTTAPHPKADKAFTKGVSDFVHDPQFGETGLGGSKIIDHENHVWSKAATNLENSRLRDLVGRKFDGVKNLLMGRLAGVAMGGASGYYAGGGSHLAGVAGALIGATLGENAYWGSLRAATYKDIANLLNAGDIDGAANIIQRSASAYAADRAIKERERNHRAQKALRAQAEGVVGP